MAVRCASGALLAMLGAATAIPLAAQQAGAGSFLIAPTRLVFSGRTRTAELTLSNTGAVAQTYRIGMTFYTMGDNGDLREVPSPSTDDRTAQSLIRYSPRQVTLEPGTSQTVRVAVRKPADLPPGEYRSHLVFTPVQTMPATGRSAPDALGVSLQLHVGVSIAVIVRHGDTSATAALDPPIFEPARSDTPPSLAVTLRRSGNQSLYGSVRATFQPTGGRQIEVGAVRGIGVYVPNSLRHLSLPLKMPPGIALTAGRLDVRYVDDEKGDRVLAAAGLALP
jgi:P pilus assembly chaperone PapD